MRHFKYCSPMRVTLGKGSFSFPLGLHSSFGSRGCCRKRTAGCNESMYSPAAPPAFPSYPALSTFQTAVSDIGPQPCAATAVLDRRVCPRGLQPWFQKAWIGAKIIVDDLIAASYVIWGMHRIECECIVVYSNSLSMSCLWTLVTPSVH